VYHFHLLHRPFPDFREVSYLKKRTRCINVSRPARVRMADDGIALDRPNSGSRGTIRNGPGYLERRSQERIGLHREAISWFRGLSRSGDTMRVSEEVAFLFRMRRNRTAGDGQRVGKAIKSNERKRGATGGGTRNSSFPAFLTGTTARSAASLEKAGKLLVRARARARARTCDGRRDARSDLKISRSRVFFGARSRAPK